MKTLRFLIRIISFFVCSLLTQTSPGQRAGIFFLDDRSQSNINFIFCNSAHPALCSPLNTNRLSNTNLFTPEEQRLLKEIPIKYSKVTTNLGPPGSELVSLDKGTFGEKIELAGVLAQYKHPNSPATEKVLLLEDGEKYIKFESTPGDGFYAEVLDGLLCSYEQLRGGVLNGVAATFYESRVAMWQRFSNGMAVGRFYMWAPIMDGRGEGDGVAIEAQFKQPYDFMKYTIGGNSLAAMDHPKSVTNIWRKNAQGP